MVLPLYTPALQLSNNIPRDDLIRQYFVQGYTNKEICQLLLTVHKIPISISQNKRILRKLDLKRRPTEVPLPEIIGAIYKIIENSGKCLGYRSVWKILTTDFGFVIQRKRVMELLRTIDPDGVTRRRKRRLLRRQYTNPGPNFAWHIDGYDKLKPFGFAIHGAIDGFSRRILWLEVGPSNNNPQIIAKYFLDTVKQLGGCPQVCRCDLGTENSMLEEIQVILHGLSDQEIQRNCFLYGKSTSNQRIESWWSILRRQAADWWITFFKDLRHNNLFNGADPLHVECMMYCFMEVLQHELTNVVIQWNQHTMQVKKTNDNPRGKPDILFFVPDSCGARDHKLLCRQNDISYCLQAYGESRPIYGCTDTFTELVNLILPNHDRPSDVNEAADLYGRLIFQLSLYDKN